MTKIDFKKELRSSGDSTLLLYRPSAKKFSVVDVPPLQFLMVDGAGDPNTSQAYRDAITALYPVAYGLKFMSKKELERDYTVMPLEGLWWADDMDAFSTMENKDNWLWTALIMQPDWITQEMFARAVEQARKKTESPALDTMRLASYHEGLSAQILYFGPYSDEGPTIARLHEFIEESGYRLDGKHHEIYLSDARRTAPDRLKTVIRQPMKIAD